MLLLGRAIICGDNNNLEYYFYVRIGEYAYPCFSNFEKGDFYGELKLAIGDCCWASDDDDGTID